MEKELRFPAFPQEEEEKKGLKQDGSFIQKRKLQGSGVGEYNVPPSPVVQPFAESTDLWEVLNGKGTFEGLSSSWAPEETPLSVRRHIKGMHHGKEKMQFGSPTSAQLVRIPMKLPNSNKEKSQNREKRVEFLRLSRHFWAWRLYTVHTRDVKKERAEVAEAQLREYRRKNLQRTFFSLGSNSIAFIVCLALYGNYRLMVGYLTPILLALLCGIALAPMRDGVVVFFTWVDTGIRQSIGWQGWAVWCGLSALLLGLTRGNAWLWVSVVTGCGVVLMYAPRRSLANVIILILGGGFTAFPMFFLVKTCMEESIAATLQVQRFIETNDEVQKLMYDTEQSDLYQSLVAYAASWGWEKEALAPDALRERLVTLIAKAGNRAAAEFGKVFLAVANVSNLLFSAAVFVTVLSYTLAHDQTILKTLGRLSPLSPADNEKIWSSVKLFRAKIITGDFVVYTVLSVYIILVVPNPWGEAKPWYFPFVKTNRVLKEEEKETRPDVTTSRTVSIDPDLPHGDACVSIKNLVKKYPGRKDNKDVSREAAVDGLSVELHSGEILALLGHNGAGKTTTIRVLAGLFRPSSGSATVLGHLVGKEQDAVRNVMGCCQQADSLDPFLSPRELLRLHGNIRGMEGPSLEKEITQLLIDVQLADKMDDWVGTLSGGMKRKTSLAISLLGGRPFVLLDEPTTGMDAHSRRKIWDLLQRHKKGRTILLATHSMEEAEILGDRIGLMTKGWLRAIGSTAFMKQHFGLGYHLHVVRDPCGQDAEVTAIVKKHVPLAVQQFGAMKEMEFVLPADCVDSFSEMFKELDAQRDILGLKDTGVSMSSLEEVFLQLNDERESVSQRSLESPKDDAVAVEMVEIERDIVSSDKPAREETVKENQTTMHWHVFKALMAMRRKELVRSKPWVLTAILAPLIMIGLSMVMSSAINANIPDMSSGDPEPIPLLAAALPEGEWVLPVVVGDDAASVWGMGLENVLNTMLGTQMGALSETTIETKSEEELDTWVTKVPDFRVGDAYAGLWMDAVNLTAGSADYTLMMNGSNIFGAPIALAAVHNALSAMLQPNPAAITIPTLHPLRGVEGTDFDVSPQIVPSFVSFGFAFMLTVYVSAIVREREMGHRFQLHLSGVHSFPYFAAWWVTFMALHVLPLVVGLLMLWIYGLQPLSDSSLLGFVLPMFTVGSALVGQSMLLQFLFKKADTANEILGVITTMLTFIPYFYVTFVMGPENQTNAFVYGLGTFVSPYAVWQCMDELARASIAGTPLSTMDVLDPSKSRILGLSMIMLVEGPLCLIGAWFVEHWKSHFSGRCNHTTPISSSAVEVNDEGVLAERSFVSSGKADEDPNVVVLVDGLTKSFPTMPRPAVINSQFTIRRGECLGLLGPNGAGKSVTVGMLTGLICPTSGRALVMGRDVSQHGVVQRDASRKSLGVCPQSDVLWDLLTPREHLELIAVIRGVPLERAKKEAAKHVQALWGGDDSVGDQRAGTLSGGQKRMLSVACATVANPEVVILDEPSTGLDVGTRRHMWEVIRKLRERCCVLLTTHSMEEADELCDRILIQVNGDLQCLGASQELKARYGSGYRLVTKAKKGCEDEIVKELAPYDAKELYSLGGTVHFEIPSVNLDIGSLFKHMLALSSGPVADFSISQATLEQIFIHFAKDQVESE